MQKPWRILPAGFSSTLPSLLGASHRMKAYLLGAVIF